MPWTKEQRAAYMREYRAKNREGIKIMEQAWRERYQDDINRRARKRYANDPEYRARLLAKQKAARQAKRDFERNGPRAGRAPAQALDGAVSTVCRAADGVLHKAGRRSLHCGSRHASRADKR